MGYDKKAVAGRLRFVLPERIGRVAIVENVPLEIISGVLKDMGARE